MQESPLYQKLDNNSVIYQVVLVLVKTEPIVF